MLDAAQRDSAEEVPMNTRRRVTQQFDAKHVNSRRRERFGAGELLEVLAAKGSESPEHSSFMRINGLRPQSAVECQYIIESEEFNQKTELAK